MQSLVLKKLMEFSPTILVILWGLFLLFQAIYTPLHIDECYYWLYGQNLDWGYFDHPPGVALIIRISDWFFTGNLSVRFLSIVLQISLIFICFQLTENNPKFSRKASFLMFIGVFILLPLNHIYGFITTPDVPLMFSACIFYFIYKKICRSPRLIYFLLWGIAMAAMIYSKYHGVLIIFFTLVSSPKLFLNYRTYLAGALGLILLVPHFLWQYDNDFASFMYHLHDRAAIYENYYPLEYLLNVVLIFNPLLLPFFIRVLRMKNLSRFDRGLYVNLVGFLVFFALQSLRVHIQPQWIILTYIPFIILVSPTISEKDRRYLKKVFLITFPLMLVMHVFMIFDLLPSGLNIHRQKEYVEMIKADSGGTPVMFHGSYKRASVYSWYTEQKYTHSYNGPGNRKNQFNIWDLDSIYYNKEIYIVGVYQATGKNFHLYEGGYAGVNTIYKPSDNIKIKTTNAIRLKDSLQATIRISNPYDIDLEFPFKYHLTVYYFVGKKRIDERFQYKLRYETIEARTDKLVTITWPFPKDKNIDEFGFSAGAARLPGGPVYFKYPLPR